MTPIIQTAADPASTSSVREVPQLKVTSSQDLEKPVRPETKSPDLVSDEIRRNLENISKIETESELAKAQTQVNETLNKYMETSMRFSVDKDTGKTVIRLVDRESGEVVRQIPPQEYLEMVSALSKVAQTILKDLPRFI